MKQSNPNGEAVQMDSKGDLDGSGQGPSPALRALKPRGRYACIGLDVPGAEVSIRLELGDWKERSASAFEDAPREVKQGDHYRILWVMATGRGQIRMYAETKTGVYLYTGYEGLDRWDAVDSQVEKAIGKPIANIPAALSSLSSQPSNRGEN